MLDTCIFRCPYCGETKGLTCPNRATTRSKITLHLSHCLHSPQLNGPDRSLLLDRLTDECIAGSKAG